MEARKVVNDLNHAGWKKLVVKRAKESVTEITVLGREWYARRRITSGGGSNSHEVEYGEGGEEKCLPITRVRLTPITGRTHQLRVHCAAIGHPILADPAYGILGEASPDGGIARHRNHDDEDRDNDHEDGNIIRDEDGFLKTTASVALQREIDRLVTDDGLKMCLHARELGLVHPVTGVRMVFERAPTF